MQAAKAEEKAAAAALEEERVKGLSDTERAVLAAKQVPSLLPSLHSQLYLHNSRFTTLAHYPSALPTGREGVGRFIHDQNISRLHRDFSKCYAPYDVGHGCSHAHRPY
eukprot:COSAG05_NODE_371_length_10705_cov_99.051475_7_plen_108_part_00